MLWSHHLKTKVKIQLKLLRGKAKAKLLITKDDQGQISSTWVLSILGAFFASLFLRQNYLHLTFEA